MLVDSVINFVGSIAVQSDVFPLQLEDFFGNLWILGCNNPHDLLESAWAEAAESLEVGLRVQEFHGS